MVTTQYKDFEAAGAMFDLAVGVDASAMDAGAQAVYKQLYPKLFTGSQKVSKEGVEFTVSWDVRAAPTFDLTPPAGGEQILSAHLALPGVDAHFPVAPEVVQQALVATLQDSVFQMKFDDMTMTVAGGGSSGTDPLKLVVYVHASSAGGKLSLDPLKAVATVSNPSDEWFINQVILPDVLDKARQLLSSIDLPPLQYPGLSMTAPAMLVAEGHVIAMANLAGKSVPAPPFPSSWPASSFFALLSEEAKLQVAQNNTRNLIGKSFGKGGDINIGIGKVYYNASAHINSISLNNAANNDLSFGGDIVGNVSAGIKIGCTKFGLNYDLYAKPNPTGTISLSISRGRHVAARTSHLNTFVLILKPTGSPIEWILSAVTDPLLQAVTAAFSPLISQAFNGISFDVWEIPNIPFQYEGISLTAVPSNVAISGFGGMMLISGNVTIQG